jgi:prepilin-type N-terminal cleavage/methylation domain-containing protein
MSKAFSKRVVRSRAHGFTLIETAMAMVIVGMAVGGMLQLLAAGSQSNIVGNELTTGINLAKNIQQISTSLAYTDPNNPGSPSLHKGNLPQATYIWDLDTLSCSPPVDCTGQTITNYAGWTQNVSVQTVSAGQLTSTRPQDTTVPTARITVTVLHNRTTVYSTSWLVCAPDSAIE